MRLGALRSPLLLWFLSGLALILGLGLIVAVGAEAAWLAPVGVSTPSLPTRDAQVAVDGSGNVTVAWISGNSPNQAIVVAEHPAGGPWTNPINRINATDDCHDPQLAVDSGGAAVIVADCKTGATPMRGASRSAGGTWAPSVEIPSSGNGEEPRVAIDDSGNAVVVWREGTVVQSSYKKASGGWEAKLQVSPAGKVTHEPDVAVSPTGRAIATWLEDRDETVSDPVVQVNSVSRQGSAAWSGFKFLSGTATGTSPVALSEPDVTIGPGGRIAAWSQLAVSPNPSFLRNAWGSAGDFGGWGEGGSHTGSDGVHSVEIPRVSLDAQGDAVAVWRAFEPTSGAFGVQAATTGFINDNWSAPVTFLAVGGSVGLEPDVAVDGDGDALFAWALGSTVSAATRPAGTTLTAASTPISNAANPAFGQPQVAVTPSGDGVTVWPGEGATSHVAVAVDDVTPPAVSAAGGGAATLGSPVSLSATASDAWGPVSLAWNFGDGATATGTAVSHTYATAGTKTATVTATDAAGNSASSAVTVTVTSPPGAGGGGGGKGGARHRVVLSASVAKQAWKQIAKAKAIKLRCKLDVAGTCAAKATVSAAVAKRIGLNVGKKQKQVAVGKGFAQVKAGRLTVVKVALTPKALAAIGAATKPVPVALAVTGSATGNDPASSTLKLKIARR